MTKTHIRRLLKLAVFLEKLPPKRFDYGYWVGDDWAGKSDLSCGTTACALGWATTIPEFRALGLRMFLSDFDDYIVRLAGRTATTDVDAGRVVFGLSPAEHHLLFIPSWYPVYKGIWSAPFRMRSLSRRATAAAVAMHIRKFVAAKRKAGEVTP